MRYELEIEIENIKIDEEYFSFDYRVYVNGEEVKEEQYESDYSRFDDIHAFEKQLENGYALKLVLEEISEEELI